MEIFFIFQFEHLLVRHGFAIECKVWCSDIRPTDRTNQQLYDKADRFLANLLEKRDREQILAESMPNAIFQNPRYIHEQDNTNAHISNGAADEFGAPGKNIRSPDKNIPSVRTPEDHLRTRCWP